MKILMVCLGNICRSPLAQGILEQKSKQAGLKWTVDSAGTTGHCIGTAPHQLSQKVAMQHGIDISRQCCRRFTSADMISFDRIYVMDSDNYREVKRISREHWNGDKVGLLMDELYPGTSQEVPDPWYGTEKDYHLVFDMISRACDKIIEKYEVRSTKYKG
jgi:protein-tyrosine phosphatase